MAPAIARQIARIGAANRARIKKNEINFGNIAFIMPSGACFFRRINMKLLYKSLIAVTLIGLSIFAVLKIQKKVEIPKNQNYF